MKHTVICLFSKYNTQESWISKELEKEIWDKQPPRIRNRNNNKNIHLQNNNNHLQTSNSVQKKLVGDQIPSIYGEIFGHPHP